jgi:glucokinase
VSVERCVAGPAIPSLYNYLRETFPDMKSPLAEAGSKLKGEEIFEAGIKKTDPVCERVVEIFTSLYAAEAGNLALKTLPFGGLYLLSGITQVLKEKILNEKTFMFNFTKKGRMKPLLEKVPIFIVDANIGMVGAEEAASRMI